MFLYKSDCVINLESLPIFFKCIFQIVFVEVVRICFDETFVETVVSEGYMKVNEPNLNVVKCV